MGMAYAKDEMVYGWHAKIEEVQGSARLRWWIGESEVSIILVDDENVNACNDMNDMLIKWDADKL